MKRFIAAILAVLTAVFLTHASAQAQELKKLNLDDASALGLTIVTDKEVKAEGEASVKITTAGPVTVCLGEAKGLEIDDAKLLYQAKVKSDLEGYALLEMWVEVNGGRFFSRSMNDMIVGKSDWKTLQAPFILKERQKATRVVFNLMVSGKGTVWVDDIALSKEPLK